MQLPAALTPMGTSTLGLDFATMTPLIWQYARALFNDVAPIMIWVVGAVIAFFVATKLIDILSGEKKPTNLFKLHEEEGGDWFEYMGTDEELEALEEEFDDDEE